MANGEKVVINLASGLEDAERVTVAFLVGGAAVEAGKQVVMFLTKEAVRLALPGVADAVACDGCPPLERLFEQFAEKGGELLVCPICFNTKKLDEGQLVGNARLAGATPLWEWVGDGATVFSY
ncbi:MAG TPA: DsrE family protein [Gaiellaceae bacterium]|nr:DsrE family protein [Gaiellaceae bacterium]